MDTHLFRPAVDSKGLFTVNGADILGANDVSFGLVTDYGHNLMRLQDGHGGGQFVQNSFQGTFAFNYGIANALVVGVTAPVNLMSGEGVTAVGPTGQTYDAAKLDSQNLGFVALHAKARLTRVENGLGVALLAQAGMSTSTAVQQDLGADKVFVWPQIVLEQRAGLGGALKLALNAGYRFHTQANPRFDQLDGGKFENQNLITAGAGIAYRALEPLDLVAETYLSQVTGGGGDASTKLSDEVVAGVKVFVERNSYLMLGGGVRTTKGFEAADQRLFLGFIFEPSIGDRDGDGYKDDVDQCPDQPEDFDHFKDEDGCPDPDNDNDAILDVDDRCPNNPEDRDGDEDDDGCPEGSDGDRDGDGILDSKDKCPDDPEDRDGFEDSDGCPDNDNDQDGLVDQVDKCPDQPETKNGFEDEDGCPDTGDTDGDGLMDNVDKCPNDPEDKDNFQDEDGCPDPDNDADGVLDTADKCPNDAEDKDGFEDEDGCPEPDNDKDGILDVDDKCPLEPETINGVEDQDGCPDKGVTQVKLTASRIEILEKVYFDNDKDTIKPISFGLLGQVASTMKAHAEIAHIRVEGHTDRWGDPAHNLDLSQRRAESVRRYLIEQGVPADRLDAKGFGSTRPLDARKNFAADDKNRRVEFVLPDAAPGAVPVIESPAPAPAPAAPKAAEDAPAAPKAAEDAPPLAPAPATTP